VSNIKPPHIDWLVNSGIKLKTSDGKNVEVWDFLHIDDDIVIAEWAKHFRNHYCSDHEIDELRDGTGLSRSDYLLNLVFPDSSLAPGPSIRAGDFGEILVADYLRFILQYWVPHFRYDDKAVRDESTKGADILGFKFFSKNESQKDILAVYEAKAKLTGDPVNRLQDAINDSVKDITKLRSSISLNALKRKLIREKRIEEASKVKRFQNLVDRPYKEISGAAAILSNNVYDEQLLKTTDTSIHPNNNLKLLVIKGEDLMPLVHKLYDKAANEA